MGYTHYLTLKTSPTAEQFENIRSAIRKLVNAAKAEGIIIRGWDGNGEPELDERIAFNGDGASGEDHETFIFRPDMRSFYFCKTARKPYDLIVTASYLVIRMYMPDAEISSDGGPKGFWDGMCFASKVLGWNSDVSIPYSDGRVVIRADGVTEVVDG